MASLKFHSLGIQKVKIKEIAEETLKLESWEGRNVKFEFNGQEGECYLSVEDKTQVGETKDRYEVRVHGDVGAFIDRKTGQAKKEYLVKYKIVPATK